MQTFHRGGEWFRFALRDGALVVLSYDHSDHDQPETDVHRVFARGLAVTATGALTGGRCITPCPRLDELPLPESQITVPGPDALDQL